MTVALQINLEMDRASIWEGLAAMRKMMKCGQKDGSADSSPIKVIRLIFSLVPHSLELNHA